MEILTLKTNIENKDVSNNLLIFVADEKDTNGFFIAEQYYREIANQHDLTIKTTDDLSSIMIDRQSLFYVPDNYLYVIKVKELVDFEWDLLYSNNIIILAYKVKEHLLTKLSNNIVNIPLLQEWQLKDYLFSRCNGADNNALEKLFDLTKNNPYRLQNEIDKLTIFDNPKLILNECFEENMYSDLSNYTVFDLSNAIMVRDKDKITTILKDIDKIDVEPLGLVTILHNNFRNLALVMLTRQPTNATTGLSDKQIWFLLNHQAKYYTPTQIIDILLYLADINKHMLLGNIDMNKLLDIMICKVLSC